MAYPHAVATGNAVIAAAVEWLESERNLARLSDHPTGTARDAARSRRSAACFALQTATEAHVKATAVEHEQGPDMDAT